MASARLDVKGMTCDHCRSRVEGAVKAVAGVFGVYVDLTDAYAEVDFDDGKTDVGALVEAIRSAGYEAEASG